MVAVFPKREGAAVLAPPNRLLPPVLPKRDIAKIYKLVSKYVRAESVLVV